MNNFLNKSTFVGIVHKLIFFSTVLLILFSRSFVGVYIFGIRVGELIIAAALLLSLLPFLTKYITKATTSKYVISDKLNFIHKIIIGTFFLSLILNTELPFNQYFFKSSSILWVIIFVNIGYYLSNVTNFSEKSGYFAVALLVTLYFLSTSLGEFPYIGDYPELIDRFFNKYSDKVEPVKASNLLLTLIVINLFSSVSIKSNKANLIILFCTVSLILPLLAFNSRGSVLFGILYFLLEIFYRRKTIYKNRLLTFCLLIISSLIFISSTLWIFNEFNFSKAQNVEEIVESINSSEEKFSQKKNFSPDTFLTFYIYEGRIYSRDATINWRFDIWQDNFEDQFNKNKIIQGYGYSSRLPVMNDPEEPGRYGEDGLNEHVHNYFVTVFARGGIILFIVTISYWFYLINEYRRVHKNNYILVLIIPALLNASFDVAMESVQFPYLLLLSIGYLFNAKQEFQNI